MAHGEGAENSSPTFMRKLIILSIFLVPMVSIIPMPGTIVWYPACLTVMALGFLIAASEIYKINKPLAVLAAYCLFSYLVVCQQHPRAMLLLILCYAGIGLVCVISKFTSNKAIYKCVIGMAILQFGLLLLQKFNHDPFFISNANKSLSETVGFIGSHNQLGIYYAAVAPILLHFCMPLALIAVIAIIFSASSSAALGALVSLIAYAVLMRSKYLLLLLIPGLLVVLLCCQKFDNVINITANRVALWKHTVSQLVKGKVVMDRGNGAHQIKTFSPWLGAGIGNFMTYSPMSQGESLFGKGFDYKETPRWEHAHNDFIEYLFEFGWLGLPILFWLIWNIIFTFVNSVKTNMLIVSFCCLIAQAIASLGVYVIHAPVSYFMLCLTLGLFYAEAHSREKIIDPWVAPSARSLVAA